MTAERGENEALVNKLVEGLREVEHALGKFDSDRLRGLRELRPPDRRRPASRPAPRPGSASTAPPPSAAGADSPPARLVGPGPAPAGLSRHETARPAPDAGRDRRSSRSPLYAVRHTLSSTTCWCSRVVVPSIILHELAHGVTALALRRRHRPPGRPAHPQPRPTHRPDRHPRPARRCWPWPAGGVRLRQAGARSTRPGCATPATTPWSSAWPVRPPTWPWPRCRCCSCATFARRRRRMRPPGASRLRARRSSTSTDRVLFLLGFVNVTLAVFNALPIPPLDGSAVVARLLPRSALPAWYTYHPLRHADPPGAGPARTPGRFLSHDLRAGPSGWARLVASWSAELRLTSA